MLGQLFTSAFSEECVQKLCMSYCVMYHYLFCKYFNCNFNGLLPFHFTDWRILESTKETGYIASIVPSCCSFPSPLATAGEPGPSAGTLLARAACVVGSTSRPPAEATQLPHQALVSLFSGLSLSPAWTTHSNGGVQVNTTYISSPIPVSLPVLPCNLKCRVLVANSKASEAFDAPGCCKSQG